MEGIRIVNLPPARMASSGDKSLEEFDAWWSRVDQKRKDRFFPRDFMTFDPQSQSLIWFYALPDGVTDTGGFDVVDFPGGLYAVAISKDKDDADGNRVVAGIREWVKSSGVFALDERPGHYELFHVITPDEAYEAMGYRQLDIFVPIKVV